MDSPEARILDHENRIHNLETEVHDLRTLTEAVAVTNNNVKALQYQVRELRDDLSVIADKPRRALDTFFTAVITSGVSLALGFILAKIIGG